ncbi:hypothetical protein LSTR_LSTR013957 [Laodelphax striatellus]|uniref:Beta-catenin-interacting ICAT domain-containing protein n=1 Tax=Laodelphax striatellus TaxID=195883 RepID=A0A482WR24_LAOST|nr:hypothetical protein LSTR_LSTR013957 [Laodelphax striatellus]
MLAFSQQLHKKSDHARVWIYPEDYNDFIYKLLPESFQDQKTYDTFFCVEARKTRFKIYFFSMSSKGTEETEMLKSNLNDQLQRLLLQLKDIEECKDELDAEDYEETKADTIEQLQELNERISKMMAGDITLVDHFSAMQMATASAIGAASGAKQLFAKQQPEQLKQRLQQLDADLKLGHLDPDTVKRKKVEILTALRQMGEKLSAADLQLIAQLGKQTENRQQAASWRESIGLSQDGG